MTIPARQQVASLSEFVPYASTESWPQIDIEYTPYWSHRNLRPAHITSCPSPEESNYCWWGRSWSDLHVKIADQAVRHHICSSRIWYQDFWGIPCVGFFWTLESPRCNQSKNDWSRSPIGSPRSGLMPRPRSEWENAQVGEDRRQWGHQAQQKFRPRWHWDHQRYDNNISIASVEDSVKNRSIVTAHNVSLLSQGNRSQLPSAIF